MLPALLPHRGERHRRFRNMKLTSSAFEAEETIPRRYTGDGEDLSPPLEWSDAPEGTGAFALICEDPDAPRADPWVHWLAYDIPAAANALPEALSTHETVKDPIKLLQGCNTFEKTGYGGPAPPKGHGPHHYIFTLYALRRPTGLKPGANKNELLHAMEGQTLAMATLVGLY